MRIYEEKEVVKKEKVLKEINCDHCQCKINMNDTPIKHYYEVTTHHSDWGNDSIDSIMHYDFCSYECLVSDMEKYFSKANGSEEYEISRIEK